MKTKMKTTAFLLLTFVLSLSLSTAYPDPGLPAPIEIHISKAIKDPQFVHAMYLQLDDGFLHAESTTGNYAVVVFFNASECNVIGTFEEWVSFFLMNPVYIHPIKRKMQNQGDQFRMSTQTNPFSAKGIRLCCLHPDKVEEYNNTNVK